MNVAIIGCGGMGRLHAQMAVNCGLRVAVCADMVRPAAASLAKAFGAKAVGDPLAAATAKNVDIVVITTPTTTHESLVAAAAAAGAISEKPGRLPNGRAIAAAKKGRVGCSWAMSSGISRSSRPWANRFRAAPSEPAGQTLPGGIYPGARAAGFAIMPRAAGNPTA